MAGTNFLDLPAEIRNKIYGYILEPLDDAWIGKEYEDSAHARNILFVSKQLYSESSDVLAKQCTAHVEPKATPYTQRTTPNNDKDMFKKTKKNALRNFRHVVFEEMDFGSHGTWFKRMLGHYFDVRWSKCSGKRLADLTELREKLETFVAGSEEMQGHEKRTASVCVGNLFWTIPPYEGEDHFREALDQFAWCLQLMSSDSHTMWTIEVAEAAKENGDWARLVSWSGITAAQMEKQFKVVVEGDEDDDDEDGNEDNGDDDDDDEEDENEDEDQDEEDD
ncbi:hypothetical protein BU16DRAFT_543445 [Lophium mytilinum]|uniref:F-box domain-containing protein n=1 Tax=Lophium mytilinum TaxID=390894 RepID=A0A6A6QHS5_9PEZI|nr:hypothetical protein BU16DRAFT_543445 [Lophium mytilinum]